MNNIVYSDSIGSPNRVNLRRLEEYKEIPDIFRSALYQIYGQDVHLTPIQEDSVNQNIAQKRNHFIVSAPTNSGKTLVGYLKIFSDLLSKRGRCIYVVPLKALAEEKKIEIERLCSAIRENGGPKINLVITTGDYALTREFLGSPPPKEGELVICTPERLEIILRSSENHFWARSVSTFLIDEFHLLGDPRRGPCMEILVTRILVSCPWSRIVALSATAGNTNRIEEWLKKKGTPVSIVQNDWRYPILERKVVKVKEKDEYIFKISEEIIDNDRRALLVFVSKKTDAEKLSSQLKQLFPEHKKSISYLHAGLPQKEKTNRLKSMLENENRVMVATTALKMGIDAPVTDVVIRDMYLWGEKGRNQLSYSDLLQMTGRAGRKDMPGQAYILALDEESDLIVQLFKMDRIDDIEPQLVKHERIRNGVTDPVLSAVLSEIVAQGRSSSSRVSEYLNYTFSSLFAGEMDSLKSIHELTRLKMIYEKEGQKDIVCPTKLGKTVSLAGLSPESGGLLASFLRALLKLDEKNLERKGRKLEYINRLTDIDILFLCCASYECRSYGIKRIGKKTIDDACEFIEILQPDQKPIINYWRDPESSEYPTKRLLTTLRVPYKTNSKKDQVTVFYKLLCNAILLYEHAKGVPMSNLSKKFKVSLGELENNIQFTVLWVLNCLSQICNPQKCYKFSDLMFRSIKLIECLAIGSELGELMTIKGVGQQSVRTLQNEGIKSIDQILTLSVDELIKTGLKKNQAQKIQQWILRRNR